MSRKELPQSDCKSNKTLIKNSIQRLCLLKKNMNNVKKGKEHEVFIPLILYQRKSKIILSSNWDVLKP